MNIWEILGIEPTKDKKTIKRAYAAQTKVVHPEEKPEEFKRLHEAYQAALKYAEFAAERGDIFGSFAENAAKEETLTGDSINPSAEEQLQDEENLSHSELTVFFKENQIKQKQRIDTFMQHWKVLKNPSSDSEQGKWWREYLNSEDFRSIQWNAQIVSLITKEIGDKLVYSISEMRLWLWEAYGFVPNDEDKYQGEQQKLWKCLYPAYEYHTKMLLAEEYNRESKKVFRICMTLFLIGVVLVCFLVLFYRHNKTENERNIIVQYMAGQYPGAEFSVPKRNTEQDGNGIIYNFRSSDYPQFLITVRVEYLNSENGKIGQVTEEDYGLQLLEYYALRYALHSGRIEYGKDGSDSQDRESYVVLYYTDIEQLDFFCGQIERMFKQEEELQSIPYVAIGAENVDFPKILIQGGVENFPFTDVQLYDLRTVDAVELEPLLREVYMVYMFQYESWKLTSQQYREWGAAYEKLCEQWEDYEGFWYNIEDKDTGEILCRIYIPTYEYIEDYYYRDNYARPIFKGAITSGNGYYYLLDHGANVIVDQDSRGYTVELSGETYPFGRQPEERVKDLSTWY